MRGKSGLLDSVLGFFGKLRDKKKAGLARTWRSVRIEYLERRQLLSVVPTSSPLVASSPSPLTDGSNVLTAGALGYVSGSNAQPVIAVDTQLTPTNNGHNLSSVGVSATLGSYQSATVTYGAANFTPGTSYRLAVQVIAGNNPLATGRYTGQMEVTETYADSRSRRGTRTSAGIAGMTRRTSWIQAGWMIRAEDGWCLQRNRYFLFLRQILETARRGEES